MLRREFVGAAIGAATIAAAPPHAGAPLDAFIDEFIHKYQIPAASAAVSKHGRTVYNRAFGYRDAAKTTRTQPSDRFRIASSSKPLTAVAVMALVEAGKLHLDDRAFGILDGLAPPQGRREDPRLRSITVRQLLEHSGGFDSSATDPQFDALRTAADALGKPRPATHTDIIEYMMGEPLAFDPGTKFVYSNLGYNILGRIVERISGSDYGAYVKAAVLAPLGIDRMQLGRTKPEDRLPDEVEAWDDPLAAAMYSVYEDDDSVRPYSYGGFSMEALDAHGGWVASALDLTRFLDGVGGTTGRQLLSAATVKAMLSKPDLPQYGGASTYYALGWNVSPGIAMSHTGAITWGTAAMIARLPGGITYAICCNRLGYDLQAFVPELAQGSARAVAAQWGEHGAGKPNAGAT
ncbi:MAG TPA: serine hydrolase domain-containing protein [Verrucomicrobiae bacterium]|nr:serine hydrolase domain-containing protein [Verrucomicrobiae bacterium]